MANQKQNYAIVAADGVMSDPETWTRYMEIEVENKTETEAVLIALKAFKNIQWDFIEIAATDSWGRILSADPFNLLLDGELDIPRIKQNIKDGVYEDKSNNKYTDDMKLVVAVDALRVEKEKAESTHSYAQVIRDDGSIEEIIQFNKNYSTPWGLYEHVNEQWPHFNHIRVHYANGEQPSCVITRSLKLITVQPDDYDEHGNCNRVWEPQGRTEIYKANLARLDAIMQELEAA